MVVKRQCSFCAAEIEPGTGSMFVKRDGTVFHFCSSSCRKQQIHLGRVGHRFKWTRAHALKVAADRSSSAKGSPPSTAPPHRAGVRRGRGVVPTEVPSVPSAEPASAPSLAAAPAPETEAPTTPGGAPVAPAEKPKRRPRARKKPSPPAETS